MTEVSKDDFYEAIGKLNVHPQIVGKYPYTSIFKDPGGVEHGRIDAEGRYFLPEVKP